MKSLAISLLVCAAVATIVPAASANVIYHITETDEGLTTDIPGAQITFHPESGQELWYINKLPANFDVPHQGDVSFGEPGDPTRHNEFIVNVSNTFYFISDVAGPPANPDTRFDMGSLFVITNPDTGATEGGSLILEDRTTSGRVPDGGSSLALFGLALSAVQCARRKLNR